MSRNKDVVLAPPPAYSRGSRAPCRTLEPPTELAWPKSFGNRFLGEMFMEKHIGLLDRLPFMETVELREHWFLHFYSEVGSAMSAKLLRLAIAHRIQELEFGQD